MYVRSKSKGKVKFTLDTGHEVPEGEQIYSSILSSTSALYGGTWSTPRPDRLPPGKTQYPLYRRLGGPEVLSGRVRKISPPTGIRSSDRPARSESPYRLRYPGPCVSEIYKFITTKFQIACYRLLDLESKTDCPEA